MDEFSLIEKYFVPLASGFGGSLNLGDDAAILDIPADKQLIVTKDAISEGIHFIGDEDPALIAKKLLRVNLSDLAAMGAAPLCYFLALMFPSSLSFPRKRESNLTMDPRVKPEDDKEKWIARFAEGLREDQTLFNIHLAGGDTISINGPASFSMTAMGTIDKGKALKRSGAKIGDAIYVSGTLGDSALGLLSLQSSHPREASPKRGSPSNWHEIPERAKSAFEDDALFLEQRYLLPEPRLALGQKLIGIANACMDISDGLLQDLGHICDTSHVGATIHRHLLPLSKPAAELIKSDATLWDKIISGGDDYELLFTVPPEKEKWVPQGCTKIGQIISANNVELLNQSGEILFVPRKGFAHFL